HESPVIARYRNSRDGDSIANLQVGECGRGGDGAGGPRFTGAAGAADNRARRFGGTVRGGDRGVGRGVGDDVFTRGGAGDGAAEEDRTGLPGGCGAVLLVQADGQLPGPEIDDGGRGAEVERRVAERGDALDEIVQVEDGRGRVGHDDR